MDSNHRSHRQQIYSLPPLATWVTYHSRKCELLIKPDIFVLLKFKVARWVA